MTQRPIFRLTLLAAFASFLSAAPGWASAAELYNNGPAVDANGLSIKPNNAFTLSFGVQTSSKNAVADDFTVSDASWLIRSIDFFALQNNATAFTLKEVSWSILANDANNGPVVASGITPLSDGGLLGYRVSPTTLTSKVRPIYRASADIPDLSLSAGHYWLRWSMSGSLSSGPWQPPTADAREGNAQQSIAGSAFGTIQDQGSLLSVEFPFALQGTVVETAAIPEPSSAALALLGGLGLAWRLRRKAQAS
ncbi:PEP-CTERM sorting domain-containing protein [Paucibacter sp. Y2R2-4]|uniref:PEP-CTERM sorting domain-containing protein n=1 Tax=Paucibacter sp. Y2R2-4 TaxID=2893553 RepID=UPI0021E44FD0|nr:PEP-CTERM sorting domain-containing protein [Paucibacter sp. Y2R2-4]MCV2350763.1 PEP-CTERM sorting domain-containing protein [Paucibacter sp. Y2R2-4]